MQCMHICLKMDGWMDGWMDGCKESEVEATSVVRWKQLLYFCCRRRKEEGLIRGMEEMEEEEGEKFLG